MFKFSNKDKIAEINASRNSNDIKIDRDEECFIYKWSYAFDNTNK